MQLVSRRGQSSLSVANPAWLWGFWGTNPIGTEGGLLLGQTEDHKLCIDYQKTSESGQYFKKVKVWTFEEPLALQVVSRERGFGLLGNQRISRLEENTAKNGRGGWKQNFQLLNKMKKKPGAETRPLRSMKKVIKYNYSTIWKQAYELIHISERIL